MINPERKNGDSQGGHCRREPTVLQQRPRAARRLMVFGGSMALVMWLWASAGCVTTAECDEHVGCPDGAVCYQSQCLATCDDDVDCDDGEVCTPCRDDEEARDRCFGEEKSACVEETDER